MKNLVISLFFLGSCALWSQMDSINQLDEVVIYQSFNPSMSSGYVLETYKDSVLSITTSSLGAFLQENSNLYFKENGRGMVSSISLRGTSASHTGVLWNGIQINSSLNGQTDFNTIGVNSFDQLEIRKGGGSVILGSGAIGGAINLSDVITFNDQKGIFIQGGVGSFESYNSAIKANWSSDKFYAKVGLNYFSSENDYKYLGTDLKNENGAYKNYGLNTTFGFKINEKNNLSFYSFYNDSDRNTSGTITAPSNSKLLNDNNRFLLDWKLSEQNFNSDLKLAYLIEGYEYYFDKSQSNSSLNKSKELIVNYNFQYFLNNKMFFNVGSQFKNSKGKGTDISKSTISTTEIFALFHQDLNDKLKYNASLRKGFNHDYDIPLIYAFDVLYKITNVVGLKTNVSSNYRLPTFNDLYWEPGGNPNLEPENSNSYEFGLNFSNHNFESDITSYYIKSDNLIQWVPSGQNIWEPVNIQSSTNYGIEWNIGYSKIFREHQFKLRGNYNYVIAENVENNNQLIYVPKNKANASLAYQYKNLKIASQFNYTGKVYTTTSNSQELDDYLISSISAGYYFYKSKIGINFRVNNLFDQNYESVAYRPMPGRNFELNINFKLN